MVDVAGDGPGSWLRSLTRTDFSVARYRFLCLFRRQWPGYLALILLITLVGGVSLGSLAAARRTASSYSTFLASTNPSDLDIEPVAGEAGQNPGYSERLTEAIRGLPHVRHVESYVNIDGSLLGWDGKPTRSLTNGVLMAGSVDGLLFNQDRFRVISGRMANPKRSNEVMVTETAAEALDIHLDQVLRVVFTTPSGQRPIRFSLLVVGIGELNREVVEDQIARFPTYIVATPALTHKVLGDAIFTYYGVQLTGGSRYIGEVESRFLATEPYFTDFQVASQVAVQAEQSVRPDALALGVFGGIAGLATLLVCLQAIGRQLRARREDHEVMWAIGAGPATTVLDGLVGIIGSILIGAVLASVVAIALSPLGPIGPVRSVYPTPGLSSDWTVLGIGFAALVVVLGLGALVLAIYNVPYRVARRSVVARPSAAVRLGAQSRLPPSAVTGVRFALGPERGSDPAATRWALVGAVVAMVVVVATLTFGSSLQTLVARPALYGWNWGPAIESSNGYGPVPNSAARVLSHDHDVAAWSGAWFATLALDDLEVPILLSDPGAPVAAPVISGHGLEASDQIVVGATTLAQLHKHIGDTVALRYAPGSSSNPSSPSLRLTIVGVATMPAIGIAQNLHTSMGIGAEVPANAGALTKQLGPLAYPGCEGFNMVFIRLRPDVSAVEGQVIAQHVATLANSSLSKAPMGSVCGGNIATVLSAQRPAQIVNYRSMGLTPVILAGGLALGAVGALALALSASVRRRRGELALLKALGFTQRQVATAVGVQASIAALVGIVLGVPLGIALGRWLWILFAHEIGAVAQPTVPVLSVVVASLGAVVLANLVAAVPGRSAARTPIALVLHEE